jgi:DNA-binding beta-propeller fold protein YncE
MAFLLQQEMAANRSAEADMSYTPVASERAPIRVIRDNYPTYSAIAVDLNSNEVYLQDENLFGYKVFDRLTDTPPTAAFSEPKRMVGGLNTKLEFNCGLYVDPVTGDVYSVNNDTVDTMVIFSRDAEGNVPPKRELSTPHRTWGIAVDEEDQELYLTREEPPQVLVYRKMASGNEEPLRILEGDATELEDAHGIALDKKNGWMFISNHGSHSTSDGVGRFEPPSITVYPLKAEGDTAPLRIIEGERTQLNWPAAMVADSENGDLYVANDADSSILVFKVTDDGNVAPTRVIKGPKTGIRYPTGIFLVLKNKEIWLSNMGNHSATAYPLDADGDVPPLRTIRSAPQGKLAQAIGNPGAVGYDTKREEILVPN